MTKKIIYQNWFDKGVVDMKMLIFLVMLTKRSRNWPLHWRPPPLSTDLWLLLELGMSENINLV